jgi:ABC-type multidrug transport system ATPase subunit
MQKAISIEGIAHDHAGENALRGVSFSVPSGSLFGIIGADGAGKSTLFRILATLLKPQKGRAQVLQWNVENEYHPIRATIGYMPQRFSLYQDLTVWENLNFAADIMDIHKREKFQILNELLAFSRLSPAKDRRTGRLSGGMKQKLALCCAMVRKPKILLLDEPTVGVDPVTRKDFWDMLAQLRGQGTTTLVSTPYMDEAELCDEVLLLHQGRVVGQGTPQTLCQTLPGSLWNIHGSESLHVFAHTEPPFPLISLYTMGGDLHALAPKGMEGPQILAEVQRVCPRAQHILEATARVEDVLLFALRNGGGKHEPHL